MSIVETKHAAVSQPADRQESRAYTYRHTVSFEETNLVGNVYFTRHLAWQGRCREMFLRRYAPSIIDELSKDLRLVTIHVACDYFVELTAFDEIEVQMHLADQNQNRIRLTFDYYLINGEQSTLAARGRQEIGSMRQSAKGLRPMPLPSELITALQAFAPHRG